MHINSSDLVSAAQTFATEAHRGQFRKNKAARPYIVHPEEVARLVDESGGTAEETAAGWLHDVVEDTKVTLADIIAIFGPVVGSIVDGMTDPEGFTGLPLLERKRLQADRVRLKSTSVKRVKIADQISNIRDLATDPPITWNRQKRIDYAEGAKLIAEACSGVSEWLNEQFAMAYQKAIQANR